MVPLLVSALLVTAFLVALRSGAMPLGVRGEWEWLRLPILIGPEPISLALATVGVAGYALFAGLGIRALGRRATLGREAFGVSLLAAAAVTVQVLAQNGAPPGYGLAKWVLALHQKGSSGYFTVAKTEVGDLRQFLADYPTWIRGQDALHIGTHPPGLIAAESAILSAMEQAPALARFVEDHAPDSVGLAFRFYGQTNPMSPADRATLVVTGFLTLLACALTVVPLYVLARASLSASSSWSAAALWPLVPSAILFQPTADSAFPLLSTTALAFAAHSVRVGRGRGTALAAAAGLTLAVAIQFSLVFLAVGLVVAIVIGTAVDTPIRERVGRTFATGLGFLAVTLTVWATTRANPFVIWWWNQRNHARFYDEFPRTFAAWAVANLVELAVALGLPVAIYAGLSLVWVRRVPRVSLATLGVLVFLTLSGRNLSEVARLCTTIGVLAEGELIYNDSLASTLERFPDEASLEDIYVRLEAR